MQILDKEIKAVIFDLDGTLIDSTGIWHDIDKEFFAKRNMSVPRGYAKAIAHLGLDGAAHYTKDRYGFSDSIESILKEWKDGSVEHYKHLIPLKEGAKELLEYLKAKGVKLALATANDASVYEPCLDRLDIRKYFDFIIDVQSAGVAKNSKEFLKKTSNIVNVPINQTAVFEDISISLQNAYELGYLSIAVYDNGSVNEDDAKHQYSHIYLEKLSDLYNYIK